MSSSPFGDSPAYQPGSILLRHPYVQMHLSEWLVGRRKRLLSPGLHHVDFEGGGRSRLLVFDPPGQPKGVLLFVHGLGGAADSPNTLRLAAAACARGWRAASVDLRGAGGRHSQPRLYTAADLDEIDAALGHPALAAERGPRIAVGLSLGGGIVARWLGIRGRDAPVDAAVGLCPTAHLPSCAEALSRNRHFFYDWGFARLLGNRIRAVAPRSGRRPHGRLTHRTMRRLDDDFAALACGQPDAAAYWDHASAHHHASGIARPFLIIASEDDPFVPIDPLRRHFRDLPNVDFRVHRHGSHLSFLEFREGRLESRLPELLLDPLERAIR